MEWHKARYGVRGAQFPARPRLWQVLHIQKFYTDLLSRSTDLMFADEKTERYKD